MSRVLVVEDEVLVAEDVRCVLEAAGHHVVGSTGSGREAIRLARSLDPDVIVLDLGLSDGVGGREVARSLGPNRRVRIVILSGRDQCGDLPDAVWLPKPFADGELLGAIGDRRGS